MIIWKIASKMLEENHGIKVLVSNAYYFFISDYWKVV